MLSKGQVSINIDNRTGQWPPWKELNPLNDNWSSISCIDFLILEARVCSYSIIGVNMESNSHYTHITPCFQLNTITHTRTQARTHARTHTHSHTHTYTHTRTRARTRTHTHTHTHARTAHTYVYIVWQWIRDVTFINYAAMCDTLKQ